MATRTDGPRWADRRKKRAGRYAKMAGASKNRASALGYSVRRGQQVAAGDHTSFEARTLEHLDALIDDDSLEARAFIGSQEEHLHAREVAPLSYEELVQRSVEVCRQETLAQGKVDVCQLALMGGESREVLEEVARLAPIQATALRELGALALERLERLK